MLSTVSAMLCVCFVRAGNQTCFRTTKTPYWTPLMTRTFFTALSCRQEGRSVGRSERFTKKKKNSIQLFSKFELHSFADGKKQKNNILND